MDCHTHFPTADISSTFASAEIRRRRRERCWSAIATSRRIEQDKTELMTTSGPVEYAPAVDGGVGRLLFMRDNTLMAQGFDERSLALVGDAAPVLESVAFVNQTGAFAASCERNTRVHRRPGRYGLARGSVTRASRSR